MLLVICWAANSVIIKHVVNAIPPFWAAFLRFSIAFPLIGAFMYVNKVKLKTNLKELPLITMLALLTFIQISLFNSGSSYTTGGRIALFIFSYPLLVPILAHFVIKEEKLKRKTVIGCILAFIGLVIPLHHSIFHDNSTLKGDLMELGSCISLVFLVVMTKKVITIIDKWRVLFWQMMIAIFLFWITALVFEKFNPENVTTDAVVSLLFQSLVINIFCFFSYQYILSQHNSSHVSVFFFATPLLGMLLGAVLLGEAFEWVLLIGCIFVVAGIYIANAEN